MMCNPEYVIFEYRSDIVDYVTKGMVPTKKNFNKVMDKVHTPDPFKPDQGVYISEGLFVHCDKETFEEVLRQVYKNRVRNRNIGLGVIGVVALGLIIGGAVGGGDDKKNDDETV